jgi:hypothetical protein
LWAAWVCLEKTEVINSGFQLLYPDKMLKNQISIDKEKIHLLLQMDFDPN